jgi:hypothetical protein
LIISHSPTLPAFEIYFSNCYLKSDFRKNMWIPLLLRLDRRPHQVR